MKYEIGYFSMTSVRVLEEILKKEKIKSLFICSSGERIA